MPGVQYSISAGLRDRASCSTGCRGLGIRGGQGGSCSSGASAQSRRLYVPPPNGAAGVQRSLRITPLNTSPQSSNRLWKESRSYYHGKYHKQSHQYGKTDEAQAENGNDVSQPVCCIFLCPVYEAN